MLGLEFGNLITWIAQVVVIATVGAILPVVFRIRHSQSRLIYCYAVLGACLLLPVLQPWQDSLVIHSNVWVQHVSPGAQNPAVPLETIALCLLATGAFLRLAWLLLGASQVRRYRRLARPMFPVPESIRSARRLSQADATFRISKALTSPATLGHVDPVILLPESFSSLEQDAQRAVAVHELLHVRRNDWLTTVGEELLMSFMWFNPGVWWLVAQARLSREELVDAEVIVLTSTPVPYINALLSIACAPSSLRVSPAALLLTKSHLTQRMRALCQPGRCSPSKLILSYAFMALFFGTGVASSFALFPLTSQSRSVFLAAAYPRPPFTGLLKSLEDRPGQFTFKLRSRAVSDPMAKAFMAAPLQPGLSPANVLFVVRQHLGDTTPVEGFAAVRAIRPGDVVTPEDLERILAKVPPGTVEITQDEANTVTRVIIGRQNLRRAVHEIDFLPFNVPVDSIHTDAAASAADRVD